MDIIAEVLASGPKLSLFTRIELGTRVLLYPKFPNCILGFFDQDREFAMRGLQFSLKKGQKLRLESALEKLESLSSKANSDASVTVADDISVNYEDAILKYFIYSFINFFMVKKCARNCAYFSLH